MTKKDQCKELMSKMVGPSAASKVDAMSEDDCVAKCKAMVGNFLGAEKAAEFDKIK